MKWQTKIAIIGAAFLATAWQAKATVTTVAWYKLGEADPGATASGAGDNPTLDSSGNGFNLTKVGSPVYSADTSVWGDGSILSMQFHGNGDSYDLAGPVTTASANVGIEAWVKPLALPAQYSSYVVENGAPGHVGGYGIKLDNVSGTPEWCLEMAGQAEILFRPAQIDTWTHLGLVIGNNNVTFYINGAVAGSQPWTITTPANSFEIGSSGPVYGPDVAGFNGLIDQVRVFTFQPGQFSPNDFLIPEPGTLALLGIGAAAVWLRRRNR